jgi:PhnB protein
MSNVKPIPEGFNTVSAYLIVPDGAKAIEFYQKAFGGEEAFRMAGPDGESVVHAEVKIGDSMVMLSQENPEWGSKSPQTLGGTPVSLFVYSEDVDAAFKRATEAGCTTEMPPSDMFWGDRFCKVTDPFGHSWQMATHKEDVSPEEMGKRAQQFFASMAEGKQ